MVFIKYFDKFSVKNNNIVIFITKLAEINKIHLPFDIPINLKNKSTEDLLKNAKIMDFYYCDIKLGINYKIIVNLINPKDKVIFDTSAIYERGINSNNEQNLIKRIIRRLSSKHLFFKITWVTNRFFAVIAQDA